MTEESSNECFWVKIGTGKRGGKLNLRFVGTLTSDSSWLFYLGFII